MNRLAITFAVCLGAALVAGQESKPVQTSAIGAVTISSKGADVRGILHDLFAQAGKSYVLEPNVRFVLYLNLTNVPFDEALEIVCQLAGLQYDLENAICYVAKKRPVTKPAPTAPISSNHAKSESAQPRGPLPKAVLNKRLTTRFAKTEIRAVLAEITRQTGVPFDIAPQVPAFKLDAYLLNTSLKFALDTIANATGLEYAFTNHATIRIAPSANASRVTVVDGGH